MRKMKILTIVGARPQFIKAAAVSRAIEKHNKESDNQIEEIIVHTGQHYDDNMSKVFFDELRIPYPAVNLEVGSGAHGKQTGLMLESIEEVLLTEKPDWCLIYGDTNSTLAGALASSKLHIRIAHVEAGLRSFNRQMPEEINRVVADHLSDILLTPTDTATQNLSAEGLCKGVHQVGDVMYDSVLFNVKLASESSNIIEQLTLAGKKYCLATIHRAENTDNSERMEGIFAGFRKIEMPVILPLHPRTRNTLHGDFSNINSNVQIIDPVAYLNMLMLEKNASIILTDSGGVQKEAYWFKVPCITLRDETEWVETVDAGWNTVVGYDAEKIVEAAGQGRSGCYNDQLYGDGHCAEKITDILVKV